MSRELAIKALLLIPLLTLSTGLLGPDILLTSQKFATSDHVGTDFCTSPQTIHCTPIRAQVDFIFGGAVDTVAVCLIHFSGDLPGSANGQVFCKITDQHGNLVGIGRTLLGPNDITNSTRLPVPLGFLGSAIPDIQVVDDVKVIIIGPQVSLQP